METIAAKDLKKGQEFKINARKRKSYEVKALIELDRTHREECWDHVLVITHGCGAFEFHKDYQVLLMPEPIFPPGQMVHLNGNLYQNKKPRLRIPTDKGEKAGYEEYWIQGKPVLEQHCMIYCFWYGNLEFDIRKVREDAGLESEFEEDKAFDRPIQRFKFIVDQLNEISLRFNLDELITQKPAATTDPFPELPF